MQLSSYTRYYLRQLLHRCTKLSNYPIFGVGLQPYLQGDIHGCLKLLYPEPAEFQQRLQELEKLIELHQKSDNTAFCVQQNLSQIEQRILWLLGLKFLALLPLISLTIVPETATALFYFVSEGQLQSGMRHSNRLYGKAIEFGAEYSLAACHLLFTLSGKQVPFILTVSETRHAIWLDLRSPIYQEMLHQDIIQPNGRSMVEVA